MYTYVLTTYKYDTTVKMLFIRYWMADSKLHLIWDPYLCDDYLFSGSSVNALLFGVDWYSLWILRWISEVRYMSVTCIRNRALMILARVDVLNFGLMSYRYIAINVIMFKLIWLFI